MGRALVTGGTRGIGAATAEVLRNGGHEVFVSGSSPHGTAPAGCTYLQCDFTERDQMQAFAREVADLDLAILVNNAGINVVGPLEEYDLAAFLRLQQVNVEAPFVLCRAVIPGMRRRRYGRIVNVTSIWSVVGRPGRSAYATAKSGLVGLTRTLALEVAADQILVNCVAPGFVDTELTRRTMGPQGMAEIVQQIPLHRLAAPDEIARCIRFLASEENSYLTGQNIVVDGGFTAG